MTDFADRSLPAGGDGLSGADELGLLGSDQVGGYFIESLISARDALDLLNLHLDDAPDNAIAIRRVAHSLRSTAAAFGFPQVLEAAEDVQQAASEELQGRVATLVELLSEIIENEPSHKVRILIVESDPDLADLLWFTLSTPNRAIVVASDAAEAEAVLDRQPVSLIVLDLDLEEEAGQEVLIRLRSRSRTAYIPTLVLSDDNSAVLKMECLALGADAFYAKPFDPAELSSMVAVRLQRRAFIDSKDPLTGLPDRVAFAEAFRRIQTLHTAGDRALSLAVIDFDHFEQVNEIYGHAAGDRVLRRSADLISRSLRTADALARWEGQQFALLFPNARPDEADDVLYRALQSVQHERFGIQPGRRFRASFSAGICEVIGNDDLDSTFARAVRNLDEAKRSGGGRIYWEGKKSDLAGETVLVVEDDALIAKLLKQRLQREGYEVILCHNGAKAWETAQMQTVSIALLDVRLPGMNGFELLERLRRLPAYGRVPIIMLTAMGSEGDIQRGFELGADDYLIKPFSPVELMARIRRRLASVPTSRRRTSAPKESGGGV